MSGCRLHACMESGCMCRLEKAEKISPTWCQFIVIKSRTVCAIAKVSFEDLFFSQIICILAWPAKLLSFGIHLLVNSKPLPNTELYRPSSRPISHNPVPESFRLVNIMTIFSLFFHRVLGLEFDFLFIYF